MGGWVWVGVYVARVICFHRLAMHRLKYFEIVFTRNMSSVTGVSRGEAQLKEKK